MKTEIIDKINNVIMKYMPDGTRIPSKVVEEAMSYAMSAGGKRIRPLIMYLTYKALADNPEDESALNPFMAAIEMIHTSSLIHDDLPALDNDSLRRGLPTVHVKYREDAAILAGDALLNLAYETAGEAFLGKLGDVTLEKALIVLMRKTGVRGMLGGQSADVMLSGKELSEDERNYIYEKKTAALIEAPFMIGALLAGADDKTVELLEDAGRALGLAFQVQDDILDMTSDAETLGKEVGQDEKNKKNTYAAEYGIDEARKFVNEKTDSVRDILDRVLKTDREEAELLKQLVTELAGRNS
ncbi:MAG: polyprenyl synthetase family protein [Eubacterium sp.]|nr:polyprenyl synthetase family protein [Eubacterium sp.]